ncbi:MAG: hypothetical protein DLM64_04840 [Solirubrobacterales bacterium]|nr:MAG: hypothetical protein DLM64_04840 [Solirubrobacterales bacterium]
MARRSPMPPRARALRESPGRTSAPIRPQPPTPASSAPATKPRRLPDEANCTPVSLSRGILFSETSD